MFQCIIYSIIIYKQKSENEILKSLPWRQVDIWDSWGYLHYMGRKKGMCRCESGMSMSIFEGF